MTRFSKLATFGGQSRAVAVSALAISVLAACASLPQRDPAAVAREPVALATAQSFNAPHDDSPTLAQAQARLRAAQSAQAAASAASSPNLTLSASAVEQKQSYNAGIPPAFVPQGYNDYGRATLNFSYELDFWGRNRAAIAAASSEARAAQAEAAEARLMLSTSIASAYADLARLSAERAIASQSLDVRTQTVSLVTRRVNAGVDTRGELREAEAGPPAARAQMAALDEAIAQTRNQIAALMGAGPDRGLSITATTTSAPTAFGLPANLAANLIGRRPDLVAARWRAEAAEAHVGQAQAAFYPNINLAAFLGAESLGIDNLARAGSDVGSTGPALSLPIFDRGRLQAGLRRADADRDAAIAAYNGALTEALRDVADVAASERFLTARLTESRAALAAYEDAYRIARQRYDGGLANYQSVLIAEDAVLAQRLAVADLESRKFSLDVALVRALGGGFSS